MNSAILRERLRCKIVVDPISGCHRWQGRKNSQGYGFITMNGRACGVHVAAYLLYVGPIPDGYQIDHVAARGCLYHDCCNTDHLEAVTPAINVQRGAKAKLTEELVLEILDLYTTGRTMSSLAEQYGITKPSVHDLVTGKTWLQVPRPANLSSIPRPPSGVRGERHHNAKLSDAEVQQIRTIYTKGGVTYSTLAKIYGVSAPTIGDVVRGRRKVAT